MPKFLVKDAALIHPVDLPGQGIKAYVNSEWPGFDVRLDTNTREIIVEYKSHGAKVGVAVCIPLENVKYYRRGFQAIPRENLPTYTIAEAPDE